MAQLLVNSARSFIFSTAPPPPAVAGALAALELLAEQPQRVEQAAGQRRHAARRARREGFEVAGSTTQIVPLVVGDAKQAMRICELAIERGVFAQAIRPPTVPEGTSRLRLARDGLAHARPSCARPRRCSGAPRCRPAGARARACRWRPRATPPPAKSDGPFDIERQAA